MVSLVSGRVFEAMAKIWVIWHMRHWKKRM